MTNVRRGAFLFLSISMTLLLTACQQGMKKSAAKKEPAKMVKFESLTKMDPSTVVAKIGDEKITDADLRKEAQTKLDLFRVERGVIQAAQKVYDSYRDALSARLEAILFEREAKARDITVEVLEIKEVDEKVPNVTDAEIKAFYDERKIKRPLEAVKEPIRRHLERPRKKERRDKFVELLMKKYKVELLHKHTQIEEPMPPQMPITVTATDAYKGNKNAPVTIVEYSDFECPYCAKANPVLDDVMKKYGKKVKIVFKHFPLSFHKTAKQASMASLCANDQGKFWPYHDLLFEKKKDHKDEDLIKYAEQLKLNKKKFETCYLEKKYEKQVEADIESGKSIGVGGTPSFYINGRPLMGQRNLDGFSKLIDWELEQV